MGVVKIGQPGQAVGNKSFEVSVSNPRQSAAVGKSHAGEGREFVLVDTAWKNTGPVPFELGPISNLAFLIADGVAEPLAVEATQRAEGHLSTSTIKLPLSGQTVNGTLVFEARADLNTAALFVLDPRNGHLLAPVTGKLPPLGAGLGRGARGNDRVEFMTSSSSWIDETPATPGSKTLVMTLRGMSRTSVAAQVPFNTAAFLRTDRGCMAQPEAKAPIANPLMPSATFVPFFPAEGQLAFLVPSDTQAATLLVRAKGDAPIDVPVVGASEPLKPPARASYDDGTLARVHIISVSQPQQVLARPKAGFEPIVVDYVLENLQAGLPLDIKASEQFVLVDDVFDKHTPDSASKLLPCRLGNATTVPAASWRRFSLLYLVPMGRPLTLQYRGFMSTGNVVVRKP